MALMQQNNFSESLSVNSENLAEIIGLVEELVINKVGIEKIRNDISDIGQAKILEQELRVISDMQTSIKKIGLIKLKTLNLPLEDLVRQLCEEKNKNVEFKMEGLETEIESFVLNDLYKVFVYIIQDMFENEFDHVKTEQNALKIDATVDESSVTASIECNGTGFDEKQFLTQEQETLDLMNMSEEASLKFLKKIKYLKSMEVFRELRDAFVYTSGVIQFESSLNEFIRITITIPIASSILQGMLVMCGPQIYALPTSFIETIIHASSVTRQSSLKQEMIVHRGEAIPLIDLAEVLEIHKSDQPLSIVIVNVRNQRYGVLVDSIIDQTDMVVKPKHPTIKDVREFSGTTTLGDGLVTLVLDIPSIVKSV